MPERCTEGALVPDRGFDEVELNIEKLRKVTSPHILKKFWQN
jgi:hypothetical protein